MNPNYLDFEQPIADLEAKIHDLRQASTGPGVNIDAELRTLQDKLRRRTAQIFRDLTPWQVAQLARHPARPYTSDYIRVMCDEFEELAGDRAFADDPAIIGGLGRINGRSVMIIGHEKGRDTRSKVRRNFGMPRPEGYRKALRLMKKAERFGLPLLTFIDTPGAYPGIGAEERGQSEAIARNLMEMAELKIPVLCTVIGEGGSGGALAIGVGDRTLMLEYSTYSVISPEGCASILWKDADKKRDAAEQLGLTAKRLVALGLVDKLVREPIGGAHRNPTQTAIRLKAVLLNQLDALEDLPVVDLVERRYQRLRGYGAYENGWCAGCPAHDPVPRPAADAASGPGAGGFQRRAGLHRTAAPAGGRPGHPAAGAARHPRPPRVGAPGGCLGRALPPGVCKPRRAAAGCARGCAPRHRAGPGGRGPPGALRSVRERAGRRRDPRPGPSSR